MDMWTMDAGRTFGLLVGACLLVACGEEPQMAGTFGPGVSSFSDDDNEDSGVEDDNAEDDGKGDDSKPEPDPEDDGDDEGPSSSTTGTTGSVSGAFDTLTTEPPDNASTDPTNGSGGTNDTGSQTMPLDPADIVDDLEDGDPVIYERDGRIGVWYSYNDSTGGTMNPAAMQDFVTTAGGPNGSLYSAHVRGSGFTNWGAGIGFDLNNAGGAIKGIFDARGYQGVAFQVRNNVMLRFKIQTAEVVPTDLGGTCTAGDSCNDSYGYDVAPSTSWRQVVINFSDLQQGNWGQAAPWSAASLMGFQWEVLANQNFEFAIDDVGFF